MNTKKALIAIAIMAACAAIMLTCGCATGAAVADAKTKYGK